MHSYKIEYEYFKRIEKKKNKMNVLSEQEFKFWVKAIKKKNKRY